MNFKKYMEKNENKLAGDKESSIKLVAIEVGSQDADETVVLGESGVSQKDTLVKDGVLGTSGLEIPRKQNLPAWVVKPLGVEVYSLAELSDEELYKNCRACGQNAKVWMRRFAALLPEVAKRGLHRRKGFVSLHTFAAMVAGMSEYAVDRILQIHAKIKDKPALLKLFESGNEGWAKIEKVAYVATLQTESLWAEKVKVLSLAALSELVKNYRLKPPVDGEPQTQTLFSQGAGHDNGGGRFFDPPVRFSFPASRDLEFDLRLAKQRLEKQSKQPLSWNETFQMLIEKSELAKSKILPPKISKEKEICVRCAQKKNVLRICEECSRKMGGGSER